MDLYTSAFIPQTPLLNPRQPADQGLVQLDKVAFALYLAIAGIATAISGKTLPKNGNRFIPQALYLIFLFGTKVAE